LPASVPSKHAVECGLVRQSKLLSGLPAQEEQLLLRVSSAAQLTISTLGRRIDGGNVADLMLRLQAATRLGRDQTRLAVLMGTHERSARHFPATSVDVLMRCCWPDVPRRRPASCRCPTSWFGSDPVACVGRNVSHGIALA
jgi:hypothetical protein